MGAPATKTNDPNKVIGGLPYELTAGDWNWAADKLKAQVDLHEYGDVNTGNGTQDDTQAFRDAVAACADGGEIVCRPGKTYYIQRQSDGKCVEVTKGIRFDFRGASIIYKPWSDTDKAGTHTPAFYIHGSRGTAYTINAATSREQVITCTTAADAANFAEGDWILITTTATKDAWNKPDGLYNTFGYATEIQKVESANAGTGAITLTRALDNYYPAVATIKKLTMLKNVAIRNVGDAVEVDSGVQATLTAVEDCGHLFSINRCIGPVVENVNARGFRMFCVWAAENSGAIVRNVRGSTDGTYINYGAHSYLVRHQWSVGATTESCETMRCRHLLDYTASYDCTSRKNVAHWGNAAFLIHGFGERRISSYADAAFDSAYGWSYGNTSFDAGYEGKIVDFSYSGDGVPIAVGTHSTDVQVIRPHIYRNGSSGTAAGVLISSGATRVKVLGGEVDMSACTGTAPCIKIAPDDVGYGNAAAIATASATAGVDAVVTVDTTGAHGLTVGQSIYIAIDDVSSAEWGGVWAVASVPLSTQFTYVRSGTTSVNLSIVSSSPSRGVWKAGNYKPCTDITIKGVRLKSGASASQVISGLCLGNYIVEDNYIESTNGSANGIFMNDQDINTNSDLKRVIIRNNIGVGSMLAFIQVERPPSYELTIQGNGCRSNSSFFVNFGIASHISASWQNVVKLIGNDMTGTGASASLNITSGTLVSNGARVYGNVYSSSSTNVSEGAIGLTRASAAPTTGTHVAGEIVINDTPVDRASLGWVCTVGGTPGTWREFSHIDVDTDNPIFGSVVSLYAAAGVGRDVVWQTSSGGGSGGTHNGARWIARCTNDSEAAGGNAGSNWQLISRDDDGAFLHTLLNITRSVGLLQFGRNTRRATANITYSASMTPDPAVAEIQTITVTNGSAMTINGPTGANSFSGMRLGLLVKNASGGAMGAITWNAIYHMSAWTNPANGQFRYIEFVYDGTNWLQVNPSGVDVAN